MKKQRISDLVHLLNDIRVGVEHLKTKLGEDVSEDLIVWDNLQIDMHYLKETIDSANGKWKRREIPIKIDSDRERVTKEDVREFYKELEKLLDDKDR